MSKLTWDNVGERTYETGVDHGVLYLQNGGGEYDEAHAWNGLVSVTESPSGAESNKQYADNIPYLNLLSAEEFGGTLEAFTYPRAFAQCNGSAEASPGVHFGQQGRRPFGLSYRTKVGNDLSGQDFGYKLHLVYGAQAAPSEVQYSTINDSPEAATLSWDLTTTPIQVEGYKPLATVTIDSTDPDISADALAELEDMLYGTDGTDGRLPLPDEVKALFDAGTPTVATPTAPTYNSTTKVITIPTVTGVVYKINGVTKTGTVTITEDTVVHAVPADGYVFPDVTDDDWFFDF